MKLPIDTSGTTFLCAVPPVPVVEFETKRARADENGEPLVSLQVVALFPDAAEVLKVVTVGSPRLAQGQPIQVTGLVANYWSMGDRSGVSFRAARVEPAMTAPAASQATPSAGSASAARAS